VGSKKQTPERPKRKKNYSEIKDRVKGEEKGPCRRKGAVRFGHFLFAVNRGTNKTNPTKGGGGGRPMGTNRRNYLKNSRKGTPLSFKTTQRGAPPCFAEIGSREERNSSRGGGGQPTKKRKGYQSSEERPIFVEEG